MKEKTFEELALDESFRMNFGNEEVPMVKVYDVVKLLQQVREATIDEVLMHAREEAYKITGNEGSAIINFGYKMKLELPTDRILTDK